LGIDLHIDQGIDLDIDIGIDLDYIRYNTLSITSFKLILADKLSVAI